MAEHAAVRLTPAEARLACLVGVERRLASFRLRDRPGIRPEMVWLMDMEGAGAELAVAKVTGWYWDGAVGTFHDRADVRAVHVRHTIHPAGHLLIRPGLDVAGIYVLVTGMMPDYAVQGWARWPGCEVIEARPDPARAPALMVQPGTLREVAELVELAALAEVGERLARAGLANSSAVKGSPDGPPPPPPTEP